MRKTSLVAKNDQHHAAQVGTAILWCLVGTMLWCAPSTVSAKFFTDRLTTDFYGGTEDNIQIGQNLDGDLQLAQYSMLGNWSTTSGPSNTSLYLSDSTVYNGKIYLTGGFGKAESTSFSGPTVANALNKIWYGTVLADGKIDEWKEADDKSLLPQPTYGHSALTVNGRLYIIGGRSTANATLNAVYWAKIIGHDGSIKAYYKTNTWTAVASLPMPLFRARAVACEGRIYVVGGQNGADIAQNTVYFGSVLPNGDIPAWNQTSAPLPLALAGHSVVVSNGRIYVLGGSTTGEPLNAVSDVYVGTIDVNTGDIAGWTQTTNLPESRYAAAATVSSGKIWVTGGVTSGTAKADVFYARIDRVTGLIPGTGQRDTWSRATDLPIAVYNHNFIAFNGHLFVLGGLNNNGVQDLVYSSTLAMPKVNISRWVPTTPLFLSSYGGSVYDIWTGHTAVLRVPLPGQSTGISSGDPTVFVIGGGPNTFVAYAGGMGDPSNQPPAAYSTIYNSEVDPSGSLKVWAAPDTGGSILLATINHASTMANGAIYVIGGANSINAWIWTGAASRSLTAEGQMDGLGRPYQTGKTTVMYEEVGQGSSSGGTGSFEFTAPIPIYDPAYELGGSGGYVANTATPIYQPLMRHAAVSHNGNIYVIGGVSRANIMPYDGAGDTSGSNPVYEDRVWYCRPNPGGTINPAGGAGGWQETSPLQPTALAPSLAPRYDMAACVAYGRVYIFGGRDATGVPQDDVFFATVNSDGTLGPWNELITSPLPAFLAEHQVLFTNGRFYVIGGANETGLLRNSVYYCTLDPATGTIPTFPNPGCWELSNTTLEYPVAGHQALANNGFLYVLGGRYNPTDPHTSSAYMTNIIDLFQTVDIYYSWAGTFERYIDLNRDQLVQSVDWRGDAASEVLMVKCRYAMEKGQWSPWTAEIPFTANNVTLVQQFARYVHYKVRMETLTNERANIYRTPILNQFIVDYAESKQVDNDAFQINHNRFDPQTDTLLITYKTRDHSVSDVILRVYNLEGELIRRQDITIPAGTPLPATGSWIWDGTNENAELVANGVYIIQYNSGNTHKVRKVVVYKR